MIVSKSRRRFFKSSRIVGAPSTNESCFPGGSLKNYPDFYVNGELRDVQLLSILIIKKCSLLNSINIFVLTSLATYVITVNRISSSSFHSTGTRSNSRRLLPNLGKNKSCRFIERCDYQILRLTPNVNLFASFQSLQRTVLHERVLITRRLSVRLPQLR